MTTTHEKATRGHDALFPFRDGDDFGKATFGADTFGPLPYETLDHVLIAPPLFTPLRMERMVELGREPHHTDVDPRVRLGRFIARAPIVVSALGGTEVANKHGPDIARAAARAGIVMTIGENVATTRGYATRHRPDEPCLKERMIAYLEACDGTQGGLLIQQSVEDADAELWNRIYSDPDLAPHFDAGLIGFEIKAGQGAKPGLGGETRISRDEAIRLKDRFQLDADPETTDKPHYDRYAAPGTYTPDILASQIRLLRNNFPKASIWLKLGGFRDMAQVLDVAESAGIDGVTIDGHAGGTGMAPTIALKHLGLPTTAMLGMVAAHRRRGSRLTMVVAGGLKDGADAVKARAIGADAIALGRSILEAARADGEAGVRRFLETTVEEAQMLSSAVGKYHMEDLAPEDVAATTPTLARALAIPFVHGEPHGPDAIPTAGTHVPGAAPMVTDPATHPHPAQ